jgi:SAM-dependent methyltransferase
MSELFGRWPAMSVSTVSTDIPIVACGGDSEDAAATGDRRPRSTVGRFYDVNGSSAAEAARLRTMAALADVTSLRALEPLVDRANLVVADVGAGESTSLGSALRARNPSVAYIPVDLRGAAVRAHRLHGFDGRVGSATDLPIDTGTVDAVHLRFVFAWLDAAARSRAVEEILRVTRGRSLAVIIDYDWGSATGPNALVAWRDKLLGLLTAFGFDPYYGRLLAAEFRAHLTDAGLDSAHYVLHESHSTLSARLEDALPAIDQTVQPVVEQLAAIGLNDDADDLANLHAAVVDHAHRHPDAPVTFPTIRATAIDFTRPDAVAAASTAIEQRRATRRRTHSTHPLPPAGPAQLGVYRLETLDLIDQARRLHAAEYLKHGHLTTDAIDGDGFVVANIDPPDVLARSRYLGVLDHDGLVTACLRIIRPAGADMTSLPILQKLIAARGPDVLTALPFQLGSALYEVSGLAKSSGSRDHTAITRLLLAGVCEARRLGDDYAVMGIVDRTAKILTALYGSRAIRPLDDTAGTITMIGIGIRPGGVTLIPCYSATATFAHDCLQHCHARPDQQASRLNLPLIELTAAVLAGRSQTQ